MSEELPILKQSYDCSDSGFVDNEQGVISSEFVGVESYCHNSTSHTELHTATRMGKRFVLKSLKEEYRDFPSYRSLLHKEFEIGYHLSHPNIVQTITMEHVEGLSDTIVMEYIDGITLTEAMSRGMITRDVARKVVCQICDALQYIHSLQQIHRDLKPDNIMLTHNGLNVKIIDFGLSDSDSHAIFKHPAGTRRYASPELVSGEKIDNRSDLFALGVIIRKLTTDRRMLKIANRCCAESRNKRYKDAAEVKSAVLQPSTLRRMLPLFAAIVLMAVSVLTTIFVMRSSSGEVVDSGAKYANIYNSISMHVDSVANARYGAIYSRLDNISTFEEMREFTNDVVATYNELNELSINMLDQSLDSTNIYYRQYRTSLLQSVLDIHTYYNNAYVDTYVEVSARLSDALPKYYGE